MTCTAVTTLAIAARIAGASPPGPSRARRLSACARGKPRQRGLRLAGAGLQPLPLGGGGLELVGELDGQARVVLRAQGPAHIVAVEPVQRCAGAGGLPSRAGGLLAGLAPPPFHL